MNTQRTQQATSPALYLSPRVGSSQHIWAIDSPPTTPSCSFLAGSPARPYPWSKGMYPIIEDLARDRMRQIQRDAETSRQVRSARAARKASRKAASL